ncbi:MAG: FtsX-like permease family protein [Alphaproteobacteria bacterium]|nr:FtsX-like permease family protein [Alphaproteobacteria bacterium]
MTTSDATADREVVPWGGGLLALSRDDARLHLPAIAAAATFLTCLALALALAASSIAGRWKSALEEAVTVEIAAHDGLSASVDAALRLLRGEPGIASAEPLSAERVRALLAPWLGDGALLEGLPLPALIDVRLAPDARPDLGAIGTRLAAAVPSARLDDHRGWRDSVARIAWLALAGSGAMLAAVLAAAVSAVVFATRARLAMHRDHIEILHLMGATDATIAREFALDAIRLAAVGGLVGFALALTVIAALVWAAAGLDASALPLPRLGAGHWLAMALPLPLGAALAGATALLAALGALRRMT